MGGKTPGGSDRYAQDPANGEAFVISGAVTNPLDSAESRLIEREFNAFELNTVGKVQIVQGDKTRELVPHQDGVAFWSNPDHASEKDETASNWMTKLAKLRVTEYVETPDPPVKPEDLVVRINYFDAKGKALGFIEVVRRPPSTEGNAPGGEPQAEFYARSAHTRWYARVLRSTAEGLAQDLDTLLGQ
jgi:hypothetical protein